jgi:hypothetical protein
MELIENAVHLCVDMQRIFAKRRHLGNAIIGITAQYPERTIFTRFSTPNSAEEALGRWKVATQQLIGRTQLELVPCTGRRTRRGINR